MKKKSNNTPNLAAGLSAQNQLAYEHEASCRAYELWEASGRKHGEDLNHWLQAEKELHKRRFQE